MNDSDPSTSDDRGPSGLTYHLSCKALFTPLLPYTGVSPVPVYAVLQAFDGNTGKSCRIRDNCLLFYFLSRASRENPAMQEKKRSSIWQL